MVELQAHWSVMNEKAVAVTYDGHGILWKSLLCAHHHRRSSTLYVLRLIFLPSSGFLAVDAVPTCVGSTNSAEFINIDTVISYWKILLFMNQRSPRS